jgi:hypothetical protein
MATYHMPIVVEIQAYSYEEAEQKAADILITDDATGHPMKSYLPSYEYDNEGQRVIYLHPEHQPL